MLLQRKILFLFCVTLTVLVSPIIEGSEDSDENFVRPNNCRVSQSVIVNITEVLKEFKQELLSEVRQIVRKSTCDDPVSVRALLGSGRDCTIKNRQFSEYFFASGGDFDDKRRLAFSWTTGTTDSECFWNLVSFDRSKGSKYKIKSGRYDEYLYAANDDLKYDEKRRHVFTWKPKTLCDEQCYWDIQRVKQEEGATEIYFTLRSTHFDEYLHAADGLYEIVAERRYIFTWKNDTDHDVQNDHRNHWIIKCK